MTCGGRGADDDPCQAGACDCNCGFENLDSRVWKDGRGFAG